MASLPVNRIKKKNIISNNGELCVVLECQVRTPPNNASYCQMEVRSIKTGAKIPIRCGINVSFEVFDNSIKQLELSYEADGSYVFIDPATFEEFYVSATSLEDSKEFLIPGTTYQVLFVEDKPITVDLPPSVTVKVLEAPPAVKGDTAGNVQKTVTCENGLQVNVPLFIKEGEIIKVSTENKEYQGRA
ncbi:MAG TPA: elongation factor P [Opitutae bacterium]|jgi:elongation factor P|nr:elongation factor P [Opitutae bacterium]